MYVRATARSNKHGSVVRYLQLAHNVWDAQKKRSRTEVLYNFGREDAASRAALERLAGSLSRFLGSAPDPQATLFAGAGEGFEFLGARPLGGSFVLDGLWGRLGIDAALRRLLKGKRRDEAAERVLFALVASRALAPSSKLAAARRVSEDVHIEGPPETTDDAGYRAMDWLLEVQGALEKELFHQVASLLSLEVELLFFDSTSTSFERDEADEPLARDERGQVLPLAAEEGAARHAGFRSYGRSKDHRPDQPQVVVGMAVTREGIPVRVWSWPGSTSDSALIRAGEGGPRRLDPRAHRLDLRPRLHEPGEPPLPAPRRRALHPRREAALGVGRGQGGARAGRPLPGGRGQPARERGAPRRERALRGLP